MILKTGNLIRLVNEDTGLVALTSFIGLATDEQGKVIGYVTPDGPFAVELWDVYVV